MKLYLFILSKNYFKKITLYTNNNIIKKHGWIFKYFDTSYPARREKLKQFAQNSEVQWCLETICNAAMRFNDENYYMLPKFLFGNLKIKEDL